jgi:hypothetical protein
VLPLTSDVLLLFSIKSTYFMIEKLNKDEMPAILPLSRKGNTVLRVMLLQLEIGEGLFLPKEDWKAKNGPRFIVAGVTKTHGFRYEFGWKADGTGWLFRRTA